MTYKKQGVKAGKEIRRQTGIKLPLAMRAGKKFVRYQHFELINDPVLASMIEWERGCVGGDPQCDCDSRTYLVGPKGKFLLRRG